MKNLIINGDFSASGQAWTGEHVTFFNEQAHIANVGHIEQEVELPSVLAAGTVVKLKFDLSEMYGSNVSVSLNKTSYPPIREEGHHEIAFSLKEASNNLTLRFQASNNFTLDNVEMSAETECTFVDVLKNGDFSELGQAWTGEHVTYFNGQAHISNVGYIEQQVELSSEIAAGTPLKVIFDVSRMYGSNVSVSLNKMSYPVIREEGNHEITFLLKEASNVLTLRLQASNNFALDNVKLLMCSIGNN